MPHDTPRTDRASRNRTPARVGLVAALVLAGLWLAVADLRPRAGLDIAAALAAPPPEQAQPAEGAGWPLYTPPLPGGVPRPFQAKTADSVSVRDFGAVGDGVADDTAALKAAIEAVLKAGGGTLTVPAGTYRITAEIDFPEPSGDQNAVIEIVGTPRRSILQADMRQPFKGAAMLRLAGAPGRRQPGHLLRGLYFTTNDANFKATNPHPAGLWSEYTGGLKIEDCQFTRLLNVAVLVRAAWDAYLDKVYIWGCGAPSGTGGPYGALRIDSLGAPPREGTNTVFVSQTTIEQFPYQGLVVESATAVQATSLKIHAARMANPFKDRNGEGLVVNNCWLSFFTGLQLSGTDAPPAIPAESGFVRVEGDCVGVIFSDILGAAFPQTHTFAIHLTTAHSEVVLNNMVFATNGPASGYIRLDPASRGKVALGAAIVPMGDTPVAADLGRFAPPRMPPAPALPGGPPKP